MISTRINKAMAAVPSNNKGKYDDVFTAANFIKKEKSMSSVNEILLRKRNKMLVSSVDKNGDNACMVATMQKNVEDLGFTFSENLFRNLSLCSRKELKDIYLEIVLVLKNMVGADVVYKPMYPNFPESVMEKSDFELYFNAIVHYWSFGTLYPIEEKKERLPLFDVTKVKVIDLATVDDVNEIFENLCMSKTSISQSDKDDIKTLSESNMSLKFPNDIPLKENAALIGKIYLENNTLAKAADVQKWFKTATDVLRLVTAMSDGDISLATNTRFRSFKRRERRILLELLENCGSIEEDMNRYKNRWIRVGERLHPAEYQQFKKCNTAFSKLRNNEKIYNFGGKVDAAILNKDYKEAVRLLSKRPGELARKLDYLLRITDEPNVVINSFKDVASDVATTVLLQVKEHFSHRNDGNESRVFFPKGQLARCHCIKNELPDIQQKYCDAIVKICENALVDIYKTKDFLGNVYLSEEYKNYVIPFSQRSASKAFRTITRGSRLNVDKNAKEFRGFIWWTNNEIDGVERRIDVDLSAAIFDENWNYMEHVSYTNLKSDRYQSCHSGDITNGGPANGDGVTEFIDVDIDSVVKYGARYVVFQVYNYTGYKYSDMVHAMFGWMEREDVRSGEIYEPKTVKQKIDLTSESTVEIPVIFDCVERKVIWCDMSLSINGCHSNYGGNNVESNLFGVAATCYSLTNISKPNLYDLIQLHIRARGLEVDNKEDADIVFDIEDGITPFDTDLFMAQYL